MTIIQLNNENKTQIEFTYDSGIPYKKEIRPAYGYGDWEENNQIVIIKVDFNDKEFSLFQIFECPQLSRTNIVSL